MYRAFLAALICFSTGLTSAADAQQVTGRPSVRIDSPAPNLNWAKKDIRVGRIASFGERFSVPEGSNTRDTSTSGMLYSNDRGVTWSYILAFQDYYYDYGMLVTIGPHAVIEGKSYMTSGASHTRSAMVLNRIEETHANFLAWTPAEPTALAALDDRLLVLYRKRGKFRAKVSQNQGKNFSTSFEMARPASNQSGAARVKLHDSGEFTFAHIDQNVGDSQRHVYVHFANIDGTTRPFQRVDPEVGNAKSVDRWSLELLDQSGKTLLGYMQAGRNGGGLSDQECFLVASHDRGLTWIEHLLSTPGVHARSYSVDAEGDLVAAAWIEDDGTSRTRVRISRDGGLSFGAPYIIPEEAGPGRQLHVGARTFVDGNRIVVGYYTDARTARDISYLPNFVYSVDAGTTWSPPIRLRGLATAAGGSVRWGYTEGGLVALAQKDNQLFASGVRFPIIDAEVLPQGQARLMLFGIDPSAASSARWAISTTLGRSPHPENSALELELGFSSTLLYTFSHPVRFSSNVQANGTASCLVDLPAGLAGQFYVQAWANVDGSTSGGTLPSDVLPVSF